MTIHFNRRQVLGAAAAGAAMVAVPARAQGSGWPTKPVMMVVPFPAGGGTDAFARPLAAQFAKQTGRQLVIDNKGGAGGTVGASVAARAAPDGYSLFMGAVHHTIAPSMYPKLDYDLEKDLVPISLVARVPQVLVVNPKRIDSPDFKAFLALVKKNPGKYNYGSAGSGTSHHLAGELFKQQTKTFITHIPYRGAGPALQDLIAGNVDMMFDGLGSSSAHIKGGRICSMAVADGLPAAGLVLISYPLHPPGKPENLRIEHLPRLEVPCLFVSGTKDAFGRPDELEAHTAAIPGPVEHVWLEGKGHDLKGSDGALAEIVSEWVGRLGSRRRRR
jgi:tripartite-type tricarboxylate transporter receptor subunit TctC